MGGECGGAGKWVICKADDDSSTSGSGSKQASSDHGRSGGKTVCTVRKLDPQPAEGSMYWDGKSPKDGAVYERACKTGPGGTPVYTYFVAKAAPNGPPVDPETVARQAVSKMKLSGPDIASPATTGEYIIGMPMWMWVRQSPTTYGPNSASASAGGVTVTAVATVSRIDWKMGDGSTVTCNGPGTVYSASYGNQDSPTCGHTYSSTSAAQQGSKYTVTATSMWTVNWQVNGDGGAGQFTETRQSNVQVPIGEMQVVR